MHAKGHAIAHAIKAGKLQAYEAGVIIEPGTLPGSPLQGSRHSVLDKVEESQI